ncbi:hypothetical protein TRIUR3_32874 [Triticum urartu]|uniref:Uncharacterized protein n=1 Tax=Triticum urartu TaxID=4572 RepID=M7Z391_TRIUA|nr:hypothetical protein TRIUR3_32874 [Triticum urartu]
MAIALAQTSRANLGLRLNHGAVVASPSWKLYHNPHYFSPRGDSSGPSRRSPSRPEHRRPMIVANFDEDDGGGGMERQLGYGDGGATSVPELLARVEELAAELEFERRMRRKVEALNEALGAERRGGRRRGHSQSHRREVTGGENPHIRRGIKGSVEFPRAVRVRPRGEERVDLVSNIECQRAQLRVLMRHRSPATAGMPGLVGAAPDNLVV